MSVILVPRSVGPLPVDCVLFEGHSSTAEITDNPIEDGSSVNDHAYIGPKRLTLEVADEKAAETYVAFVELQADRDPFDVVSGLAVYPNMLIENIEAKRDKKTSQVLIATIFLREIVIVGKQAGQLSENSFELPPTVGPSLDPVVFDRTAPVSARGDALSIAVTVENATAILMGVFS